MRTRLIALALCFLLAAPVAFGQSFYYSARGTNLPYGRGILLWNATGSQINDGTVVMADTVSTGGIRPEIPLGKGFVVWSARTGDAHRVIGVLVNNVAGYNQGFVLTDGYHQNVSVDSTSLAGLRELRLSYTKRGALSPSINADSTAWYRRSVGAFQRYERTDSLRARCYLNF